MPKSNFLLYKDNKPAVMDLSDKDAGQLFKGIYAWVNGREEYPIDDPETKAIFNYVFKKHLEKDLIKYKEKCAVNSANGKIGGRPKNNPLKSITGKDIPKNSGYHFTYLIYDKVQEIYKIGETKDLIQRRYDIKQPTNNLIIYDFMLSTPLECQTTETNLIKKYSYCRISGDWFDFSEEDVKEIISLFKKANGLLENQSLIKKGDKDIDTDTDIDKEIDTDIKDIIDFWNSLQLTECKIITNEIVKLIELAIKEKSKDEVMEFMNRYNAVTNDPNYFWSYSWNLVSFLTYPKTKKKFVKMLQFYDDGEKWIDYNNKKNKKNKPGLTAMEVEF